MSREDKPILGTGPIFWIALPVLLGLVFVAATGRDLQWDYLRLVGLLIGNENVGAYVNRFHIWHALSLSHVAGFNLVSMVIVIVALRIHPGRFGWWRYTLVVVWALTSPLVWVGKPARIWLSDGIEWLFPSLTFAHTMVGAYGLWETIAAPLLWVVTRSWRVTVMTAGMTIGCALYCMWIAIPGPTTASTPRSIAVLWQLILATILLFWAIRSRQLEPRPGACVGCGYALDGLRSSRCPECGLDL